VTPVTGYLQYKFEWTSAPPGDVRFFFLELFPMAADISNGAECCIFLQRSAPLPWFGNYSIRVK
jgi:hypothetical protein